MGQRGGQSDKSSSMVVALLQAMRIPHWLKNVFVIIPILFAGVFRQPEAWLQCGFAVGAFCLLSSAVYLINDICDRQADRAHPDKCNRPIASGRLSLAVAIIAAVFLIVAGFGLAVAPVLRSVAGSVWGGWGLAVWAAAYLVLNLLYSIWLKHYPIIDVILVSLGFVLRAVAGAAAIAVPISPWLVVCTFTLCLYIALSKRRAELADLPEDVAATSRTVNREYSPGELDRMLTVSAAMAIMTYALYCLAPRTVNHIGSAHLVWTIPLVIYGLFRYDCVSRRMHKGDVVNVLLADRILWLVVTTYVVLVVVVILYGSHPAALAILDMETGTLSP